MNKRVMTYTKSTPFKQIGIGVLVALFVVSGLLFIRNQIDHTYQVSKENLFNQSNILSDGIVERLTSEANLLKSKRTILEYFLQGKDYHGELDIEHFHILDDRYIFQLNDNLGNPYYVIGENDVDLKNEIYAHELKHVSAVFSQMEMFHGKDFDRYFYYQSNTGDYIVIYPSVINPERQSLDSNNAVSIYLSLKEYVEEIKQVNMYGTSANYFGDGDLISVERLTYAGVVNRIGIITKNPEQLLSINQNTDIEDFFLLSRGEVLPLYVTKKEDFIIDSNYYTAQNTLRQIEDIDNVYHYRRIDKEIVFVSRSSKETLRDSALNGNINFILVVTLSYVLILFGYFYFRKYKRYSELEMITSEQETTKTLYQSRLGYIMNTISEAFILADSTYTIQEVNDAAADIMGYSKEELLGHVVSEFMEKPLNIKVRKNDDMYNCYEVSLERKDGTILYGLANKSTVIKDNPIVKEHYIMISDITPLIEAQKKAEEANRSKSRFIANLSHEIRTPMNATIGYIYLLEQTELTDMQKKYLERMDYASNTLLGIIDEILDFSKIEADKISIEKIPFELHNVIKNAVSMFENTAFRKDIKLSIHIDEEVPQYIVGDPFRIRQVLINILSNAFKFTSFGEVSVNLEVVQPENCKIIPEDIEMNRILQFEHQRIIDNSDYILRMMVKDSGIGIAKEEFHELFNPFVQADESTTRIYGGTGLGLAICKRLVTLMSGTIYAESTAGKGSTFFIEIPIKTTTIQDVEDIQMPILSFVRSENRKKILIVEDNPLNQELLVELLIQHGHYVVVANNGLVAIEILMSDHETDFDLILMDIQMPVQDGFITTQQIRESKRYSKVPIIAVTANADRDTQINLAKSGMNDYLLKPINASDLYTKINHW